MKKIDLQNMVFLLLEKHETEVKELIQLLQRYYISGRFDVATMQPKFVSIIEEVKPDVILSNYLLNDFTGLDALKYCNAIGYNKPFIFVTSPTSEDIAVECFKSGASDYIPKDKLHLLPTSINKAVEIFNSELEIILAHAALENREKLLETIAEVSKLLLSDIQIEEALYQLIQIIGKASGHDRAYIFEKSGILASEVPLFSQTYEWTQTGISTEIDNPDLQNLNLNDFSPELYQRLLKNIPLNATISEIPESVSRFFKSQKVLSVLLIPIKINQELWGFMGFDNCQYEYICDESDLDAFMTIGSLIANFIIRKNDELTLRENEEKFRFLAENASDVIWTMDINGRFLYVSPSVVSLRGFTPDETMNENIEDTLTIDSAKVARQLFDDIIPLIEKGIKPDPITLRLEQNCKWGGTIWTEVKISGVYNENGEFSHLIGVTRDISKRKKAEDDLKESRTLFETLTIVSPVGVFRTDLNGLTTYVNPRWQQLTGLSEKEALGSGWLKAVHPEDQEKVKQHWGETWTTRKKAELEYRFIHKDGSVIWVIGNVVPEYEKEDISGFIGTITDITSRRISETALRESEERFRNSITHAPIPIMIHSEGKILQLSDAFVTITGIHPDELRTLEQWFKMADRIEDNFDVPESPRTASKKHLMEGLWKVASSKTIPRIWEFSSSRLGTFDETRDVYISMAMDVTHKKQMEEDLFKSRQELNAIFQGAPIMIFLLNNRKEIIKVNQTALIYSGKTRQDILDKKLGAVLNCLYATNGIVCNNDMNCSQCKMNIMIDRILSEKNKSITVEELVISIKHKGTIQERIFFAHAEVLFSEPEERILFTLMDNTERILTEKELKLSEEKFRKLISNAPVGIALVSSKGKIIEVNNTTLKIFGYDSPDEIIGKNAEEFYFDKAERFDFVERLKQDSAYGLETQMVDQFGNQIWIMETAVKHIFPDGDTGHLSILEDISQRKESEAKIRTYQENLEELIRARTQQLENSNRELSKLFKAVEQSPSTVVITDRYGIIEYVNPKFCEITGYTFNEAVGNNPRILRSDDTPKEYYQQMWQTISSGKSWIGQFKNKKKNGELFWELCSIAPIFNSRNEITHFVAVKQDITEKMIAEEKLRNYTNELEVFNKTMVDRELRMIEMKEEVNQLCRDLGIPEKYTTNLEL